MTLEMDTAIKKILSHLEDAGISLKELTALDFFAREGDWQTHQVAKKVSKIHAWEIESKFEKKLRDNLPSNAEIVIGDSFETLKSNKEIFDLIVLDNPQGCFGNGYCEHFEALPSVLSHLADSCVIIINVKVKPFNYEDKHEWRQRRNDFYGVDATCLDEEFVFKFYNQYFSSHGFYTDNFFWEVRPQETGLYQYAAKLSRKK